MIGAASLLILTYLVNALWQVPLIVGAAYLCLKLIRRSHWSHQHMLWVAALILCVLVPLWGVKSSIDENDPSISRQWPANLNTDTERAGNGVVLANGSLTRVKVHKQFVPLDPAVIWILAGCYVEFILYRIIILVAAWERTRRLRRTALIHSGSGSASDIAEIVQRCAKSWGIRQIPILSSSEAAGPLTLGFVRPVLVLPSEFVGHASERDFVSAIHHELAHVRRHDYLLNIIYQLLYLPISVHPVASLIIGRIDRTRELACDEMAAEKSTSRIAYAQSLLNIAQSMWASSSVGNRSHALGLFEADTLEERILSLLKHTNRIDPGRCWALGFLGTSLFAAGCFAASLFSLQIRPSVRVPSSLRPIRPGTEFQTGRVPPAFEAKLIRNGVCEIALQATRNDGPCADWR